MRAAAAYYADFGLTPGEGGWFSTADAGRQLRLLPAPVRRLLERHVWGLGRHYAGSNFFWYLKDPAGNFSEYYSDMDCIIDDQLWTPEELEGARGLFAWGPPPPPSFLHPEDLAAMMTGAHSTR